MAARGYNAESHAKLFSASQESRMMFRRLLPIPVVAFIFCWPVVSRGEEPFRFPEARETTHRGRRAAPGD